MGTGSVDVRYSSGDSRGRRCLSPFSGGAIKAPWKKGTGTEPATSRGGFGICSGSEPVPIFHSMSTASVPQNGSDQLPQRRISELGIAN